MKNNKLRDKFKNFIQTAIDNDMINKNPLVIATTVSSLGFSPEINYEISKVFLEVSNDKNRSPRRFMWNLLESIKDLHELKDVKTIEDEEVFFVNACSWELFITQGFNINFNLYCRYPIFKQNAEEFTTNAFRYKIFEPQESKINGLNYVVLNELKPKFTYDEKFITDYCRDMQEMKLSYQGVTAYLISKYLNLDINDELSIKLIKLGEQTAIDIVDVAERDGCGREKLIQKLINKPNELKQKLSVIVPLLLELDKFNSTNELSLMDILITDMDFKIIKNFERKVAITTKYNRKQSTIEEFQDYVKNKILSLTKLKPNKKNNEYFEVVDNMKKCQKYEKQMMV